ncbi:MAG TPA: ChaN family lipoprotein, partial [Thermoanaerobaculia bacterium]
MRMIIIAAFATALSLPSFADSLERHLRERGQAPGGYLLAKTDQHRIVIAGESHWQRADAELIRDLVPELRTRNVALAMEVLDAATQADIDALLAAPAWDAALANRIMRAGDWPYVQYRDILQRAWEANRASDGPRMKIIALGPPDDWREKKIRYDAFMADLVAKHLAEEGARLLVFCGMHHAFTRFQQIDRMRNGRPGEFMERMGNILWRR